MRVLIKMNAVFTYYQAAPFDAMIYYTENAVRKGMMAEERGDELIKRFQELNVAALTKKGNYER